MNEPQSSALVLGEAPESDDDYSEEKYLKDLRQFAEKSTGSSSGSAVAGEPTESDEEVDVHISRLNSFVPSNTTDLSKKHNKVILGEKLQGGSLRKLREKNRIMYESLTSFKRQILTSSNYELGNINQQLLKSQVELQQILNNIRQTKTNLMDYKNKLNDIVAAEYIPQINIHVPSRII